MQQQAHTFLSDVPVGAHVTILAVSSPSASYRLEMLGLGIEHQVLVAYRGDSGDLILGYDRRHVHLPAYLAARIPVRPLGGASTA
jgi:hypothetical protein